MKEFDLIVIGSGSGLDVAADAAGHGMKVAIVEKNAIGGTCLNRGCIPSKMLIHSADVVETINNAHLFGIRVKGYGIDFAPMVRRVTGEVDGKSAEIERNIINAGNPRLYKGEGKFVGHKTLQVGNDVIRAEKILIACGGRPAIPDIPGLRESGFITSDEALRLEARPKVLTVIGGGYIAAELAHFFGSLGTKIQIVHRHEYLLDREDEEIAEKFTGIFRQKYDVFTDSEPIRVSKKGGEFEVTIKGMKDGRETILKSDQLLVAAGRTPNSDLLDIGKTGVRTDARGHVVADRYLETNVKGIFALGDVLGRYLFKHAANLEAEYAFQSIVHGKKAPVDYSAMPHAIFASPQVASVGETEQQLRKSKTDYLAGRYEYANTARGQAIGDETGFVKILVGRTGKILGCHIMGTDAAEIIHEVIVAMKSGDGSLSNIIDAVHIHPALNEVVQRAAANVHQHD